MDFEVLRQRQQLPLEAKIEMSKQRIYEWYKYFDGNVYVSFSGGKDSTVLLDLVQNTPGVHDVPAVFVDTGLEYPEVRAFARKKADVILRPEMTFKNVLETYGYPVVSKEVANNIRLAKPGNTRWKSLKGELINKHTGELSQYNYPKWGYLLDAPFKVSEQCCDIMKKRPMKKYKKETGRKPFIGMLADESKKRKQAYLKTGCNAFNLKEPQSQPMAFWTEQDVLEYIKTRNLEYASVYGDIIETENGLELTGEQRTGCMFCMFGCHLEKEPNRFQRMKQTHPKQYDYCINKLGLGEVLDYMGIDYE